MKPKKQRVTEEPEGAKKMKSRVRPEIFSTFLGIHDFRDLECCYILKFLDYSKVKFNWKF